MKKIGNLYFHGSRNKKEIALTFDDGPSKETLEVLKILKKYHAKSTFFIWGKRIKGREKTIGKIIKDGHEIANHSYEHKRLWFKSRKFVEKDLRKCDEKLNKVGIKTNLFRFPCFKFGFNSLIICKKLKKKVIFADMVSYDWLNPWLKRKYNKKGAIKIDKVIKRTLSKTKNGSILNFHDYLEGIGSNKEIIPILKKVMPELKKKYKFVTVSKLLDFNSS